MSLDKLTLLDENTLGYLIRPYRNFVINGDISISQRATTVTGITSSNYYTADRIRIAVDNAGTWTNAIIEDDIPLGTSFRKSMKMTCTSSTSTVSQSACSIQQRFEGQHLQILKKGTANAESVTVSFWVKSNIVGTYICNIQDSTNSREISASYTINSPASWEKKTITFTGDTTGVLNNDSNSSLTLIFWLVAGNNFNTGTLNTSWQNFVASDRAVGQVNVAANSNNYFQITGIQMEIGITASPFETIPYEIQLMRCQRYYYKNTPGVISGVFTNGYANSTSVAEGFIKFPFPMRTIPSTVETSGTASDYQVKYLQTSTNCTVTPIHSSSSSFDGGYIQFTTATVLTAGQGVALRSNAINSYLAWSAEL